jgi:PIN domain protein
MKKVLADLNIVLDFLNKRNFHEEAARLIDMCMQKELAGFICAHEITTLSYFLLKEYKNKRKVIQTLSALFEIFHILAVDEAILREAFLSSVPDYEDAVIEVSCIKNNIDCIISRNISDFKLSRVATYTPEQFFCL